jgi:hypothetical protein
MPRAAFDEAANGQRNAFERAVCLDGLAGIVRAGRLEPAAAAKMRAERYGVSVKQTQEEPGENSQI